MFRQSSFDMLTGRWNNRRIIFRDGLRKLKPSSCRLYSATEIRDLVIMAGLKVRQICGSWDGKPISPDLTSMVVIAEKPEAAH